MKWRGRWERLAQSVETGEWTADLHWPAALA